jgi:hypothetical protein
MYCSRTEYTGELEELKLAGGFHSTILLLVIISHTLHHHYIPPLTLNISSQSQNYVTTDGLSASLSWNKAPIWGLRPDLYYCQTLAG